MSAFGGALHTPVADRIVNGSGSVIVDSAGRTTVSGNLTVSGTGPHAVGGVTDGNIAFVHKGAFTSDGSGAAARFFAMSGALTGATGDTTALSGSIFTTDITTQGATETIADVAQVVFEEPSITVGTGDTVTNASTVKIVSAPTEGTNNYALWSASGENRFDGPIDLSNIAAGSPTMRFTATSDTPTSSPETDPEAGWIEVTVGGAARYIPFYT